ncbi:protein zntC-like [Lucilia sericata]|uniref:protein zntC-like n=1 Tax=Lucilia sericata TaxID=13632 RepID=UPI0018A859C4|nr:protein zntC-like [Lucilia sericata]XP_037826302.1 protein zntC-like [Lucilia sericata]XP_037826303.1 protein zntC-like [Lucilia sericata]XP_037826304.1 protein zntC-like [Lucilia sericata]XP_037826305.1 protein zntC-like [Lucilia sericata]XP_037826306.1 protein zntC-like [Lucilia sericata]
MSDDHDSHDVLVAKCAAMAALFCATALFGGIPFVLNHYFKWTDNNANARSAKVVTYLLHFGGGVLLATTFIHLLPEVQEVVEHLQHCGQIAEVNFAVPETLMCAGFILMYLIEECIHGYLHRNKKKLLQKDDAAFERGHSVRRSVLVKGGLKNKSDDDDDEEHIEEESDKYASKNTVNTLVSQNGEVYQNGFNSKRNLNLEIQICPPAEPPKCNTQKYTLDHSLEHSHQPSLDHTHNYSHDHAHDHGGHGHSHLPLNPSEGDDVVTSSLRGLGIVLALSLHEVFEGLAIGLEDATSSVWFLFGAVAAHKLVLAFCVGVELIVARTRPILAAVYTITFAIVSPIGIAIGIAVSHNSADSEDSIASMILQGIACGTLLYVVFFEILSKQHAGFGSFLAMVVGFGLMFGLQNIGEGHDDHDHDHCANAVEDIVTTTTKTVHDLVTKSYL